MKPWLEFFPVEYTPRRSLWLKPLGRAVCSGHQGSPISHHHLNLNQYVGPHCHSRGSQYQDLGSHTRPSPWRAQSPWSLSQRSLSLDFSTATPVLGSAGEKEAWEALSSWGQDGRPSILLLLPLAKAS